MMTPDQPLRRRFPYVADFTERPRGWDQEYDLIVQERLPVSSKPGNMQYMIEMA